MPKKPSGPRAPLDQYWTRRVRSPAFKRALTAAVARELAALSAERVKDVVDAARVRTLIREWDTGMLPPAMVAELLMQAQRSAAGKLVKPGQSLLRLLDPPLVAGIEALLAEDVTLSRHAEEFIGTMMRQEFVRRLFTDIIFTSIVSFYEKVNPFFGGIAMRALEDQIKGFIRLFMPMVQQQATAFAVRKENQRIVLDFGRRMIRQLLSEPLPHYSAMISSGQRSKARALLRKAVANPRLASVMREMSLAVWDDLYPRISDKRLGDLLRLEAHAGWLAERGIEVLLPLLARPHLARFIATEMAGASEG